MNNAYTNENLGHGPNWAEKLTAMAAIVTTIIAITAGIFAYIQIREAVQARKAQNYLELRKTYFDINKSLDNLERNKTYPRDDKCQAWNDLKRYWYFSQTEWMLETQIDASEQTTWNDITRPMIIAALKYPMFRKSFLDMTVTRFMTYPMGRKFYCDIASAYRRLPNNPKLSFYDKEFLTRTTGRTNEQSKLKNDEDNLPTCSKCDEI